MEHRLATRDTPCVTRYPFRFAPAYRLAGLPFGVTPRSAWVEVGPDAVRARFGLWRLDIPRAAIDTVELTGPYRFAKTAGPARLALTDRGLTFATNGDRGVLIRFGRPLRGITPTGPLGHTELTVTVTDVDGLAAALRP